MDKASYKEMLSDSYNETDQLKKIIKTVQTMVHDIPNNMELGKRIRSYFLNEDNEETYIYERDGENIYRRRAGDYSNRELLND